MEGGGDTISFVRVVRGGALLDGGRLTARVGEAAVYRAQGSLSPDDRLTRAGRRGRGGPRSRFKLYCWSCGVLACQQHILHSIRERRQPGVGRSEQGARLDIGLVGGFQSRHVQKRSADGALRDVLPREYDGAALLRPFVGKRVWL